MLNRVFGKILLQRPDSYMYMFLNEEERKKQARSNKPTRQSNTAHLHVRVWMFGTTISLEGLRLFPAPNYTWRTSLVKIGMSVSSFVEKCELYLCDCSRSTALTAGKL